jgi:recombinational DNA repair protein RecR
MTWSVCGIAYGLPMGAEIKDVNRQTLKEFLSHWVEA